ncbi:MAG: FAD-dependent oxidoreductase [Methylococcaceae bacterium]|nr:FAD-dependent oxidoreductase [Methylococcaceae bacterium]
MNNIPKKTDVVIIGAGPAGSSAATHLAQAGINVIVLEKNIFPRNQVGESLIPHFWKFTDVLGVSEKIEQEGFIQKAGGITAWNNKIQQILFSDFGYTRSGLHVERDIFDNLLLAHAQENGAEIYQQISVKKVDFSDKNAPVVYFTDKRDETNQQSSIACAYVIDATGHSSLLAQQFGTRQTISSETNFLSLWGYFKNSRYAGVDRRSHSSESIRAIKPVTFVMSYEDGWLWHIVLRDKSSVGLVVHTNKTKGMNKAQREAFFKQTCSQLPYLKELLAPATFIDGSLQYRPDYSYYSTQICGDNFYCIGDAAAFVDPIFSHGVQNAFYNASLASVAIKESFKKPQKRGRYSQLCASRMQQFYGFSRALSLGDFGCNGVNRDLVKSLMKAMPPLELELMLVAAEMTNRSENFKQLAKEAGVWETFIAQSRGEQLASIDTLAF